MLMLLHHAGWGVLDALVLGLGYLNLVPGASNYTAVRALRVLRPLRAVSRLPKLKVRRVACSMWASHRPLPTDVWPSNIFCMKLQSRTAVYW